MQKRKAKPSANTIVLNKKVRHDYFIEQCFEAGIALQGWEVKSLRAGHIQIRDSYVLLKNSEAFLLGALITPLPTASTHIKPEPQRTRKLLLNRKELNTLTGAVERKGYTLVPTVMYWRHGLAKIEIGLAKGKQSHDKRESEKAWDWQRQKQRILKGG